MFVASIMFALLLYWPTYVSQAAAIEVFQVSFPSFPVSINGTVMDMKHSEYPLLVYNDITYIPMTWNNAAALGLSIEWGSDNGLSLKKLDACLPLKQDLISDRTPIDYSLNAMQAPFPISINEQRINTMDPYPLLVYRNVTYFPMTWRFTNDEFGWQTSWDEDEGYSITTCDGGSNTQLQQLDDLNKVNLGQLAVQEDWIYMSSAGNELVKVKKDGTEEIVLSNDNARNINVVGKWIYYTVSEISNNKTGVFKIRTDGTNRMQISSTMSVQMWVHDDWIYYTSLSDKNVPNGLRKMKLDGSEDQLLISGEQVYRFFITSDSIFITMREVGVDNTNLYSIGFNGSNLKKLRDDVSYFVLIDGWVYYVTSGSHLKKMNTNGTVDISLYRSNFQISALHYHKGWIFMLNGTVGIQRSPYIDKLRLDGTSLSGLGMARTLAIYIADHSLYYPEIGDINIFKTMDLE